MPSSYERRVAHNLDGLTFVSTGLCPGCEECAATFGLDLAAFTAAVESGALSDEGGFSWSGCGVCDSALGGNRYVWHGRDDDGALLHSNDACVDCVLYLANGEVPEGATDAGS